MTGALRHGLPVPSKAAPATEERSIQAKDIALGCDCRSAGDPARHRRRVVQVAARGETTRWRVSPHHYTSRRGRCCGTTAPLGRISRFLFIVVAAPCTLLAFHSTPRRSRHGNCFAHWRRPRSPRLDRVVRRVRYLETDVPKRAIYITESDMKRLRELLRTAKDPYGKQRPYHQVLQEELDRATLIADQDVDPDVVTMNSEVRLRDCQTDAEIGCTIVFPESADAAQGRISVLAPLGAALLGYRTGDRVSFTTPGGKRACEIMALTYQPEAAGDLHV